MNGKRGVDTFILFSCNRLPGRLISFLLFLWNSVRIFVTITGLRIDRGNPVPAVRSVIVYLSWIVNFLKFNPGNLFVRCRFREVLPRPASRKLISAKCRMFRLFGNIEILSLRTIALQLLEEKLVSSRSSSCFASVMIVSWFWEFAVKWNSCINSFAFW